MRLNTPSGLIDLATGEVFEHDPEFMISQITAAMPEGECPLWEGFLDRITGGDTDLAAYLQRVAGYCLTGSTSEQVFFFLHGSGANGKSVFVQTLANVLGD
jgi:putative DNA primase/helicase